MPVESAVAADDGVTLWTRAAGEGPPTVVCCHGGPGMADYLEPVEEVVAPLARCVRWDQRGAGRSDAAGPWTVERFVADLDAVRVAVGVEKVLLLGHSWGAGLALAYSQAHPDRVERLLYLSGTGLEWWPEHARTHKQRQIERLGVVAGSRMAELRSRDLTVDEAAELRLLYVRSELADVDDLHLAGRLLAHERRFPPSPAVNAAINAELRGRDPAAAVAACSRVACPVTVAHGGLDPRPLDALGSLVAALPDSRIEVIDGAGHYPWFDDPDGFTALVEEFVAGSP